MHLISDKLAVLPRDRSFGESGPTVQALYYTNLLTSAPKLMINVESGDYATLEERNCGCLFDTLGLKTHVRGVRSYEKLTSEGVTFLGSALYELLEHVLPSRFGGSPLDFQLVEEEEQGLPRITLVVSPRLGELDDAAVVTVLLDALAAIKPGGDLMADQWRQGGTLRVARHEPYATIGSKVLPLHVMEAVTPAPTANRGPG
jgi:hypothetical protein